MAIRYTPDELKFLKDSPLAVKPPGLPPAEQWMGVPADPTRNSTKLPNEKAKNFDSNLDLDQPNRRPGAERHMSRSSANPEDIILGPPKTSFMSATSIRSSGKPFDSTDRGPARDIDSRDRFNFRSGRSGDGDTDRPRDGRGNNLRVRRNEGEQDSDGWSTVKPRKSFGNEGAERFNGRMGLDRHKDDRRFKDREDRDHKERPPRSFDTYSRDKETDEHDRADGRRNGTGRGRNEPSWFKDSNDGAPSPRERNANTDGDRFADRSRGWREKDRDERGGDRGDRRWDRDRDQRQEREPEWLAEPEEEKSQAHTQEEFQKWKEQMQGKDRAPASKTPADDAFASPDTGGGFFGLEKPKIETPLAINTGPDKFFGKWAAPKEGITPEPGIESRNVGLTRPKAAGKSSRFTSFFAPQEPQQRPPEPSPALPQPSQGGLGALLANNSQSAAEKEAFQQLLSKLQSQTISGPNPTPLAAVPIQPKPYAPEKQQGNQSSTQDNFQQYRAERHEEDLPVTRNSQQALQDLLAQRQVAGSQPTVRPDQMLQELVGQRQNALSQSSQRPDQPPNRNDNTAFLMGLMQSTSAAPEPQRPEQVLRAPPGKPIDRQQLQQHQMIEREEAAQREAAQREAAQRERSASQRTRTQPPPGFFEDPAFQRGLPPQHERQPGNPPQPTQILQRPPPPPGLEMGWDRAASLPPPQHRINQNVPPPPGLANAPNRGMPIPQQMFPPGFPMGNFPPDVMPGPPRNMAMPPPPGFFNSPPPGFLPPGVSGFQGPEGMAFGGAPFDGRGPPPQGTFRRQ